LVNSTLGGKEGARVRRGVTGVKESPHTWSGRKGNGGQRKRQWGAQAVGEERWRTAKARQKRGVSHPGLPPPCPQRRPHRFHRRRRHAVACRPLLAPQRRRPRWTRRRRRRKRRPRGPYTRRERWPGARPRPRLQGTRTPAAQRTSEISTEATPPKQSMNEKEEKKKVSKFKPEACAKHVRSMREACEGEEECRGLASHLHCSRVVSCGRALRRTTASAASAPAFAPAFALATGRCAAAGCAAGRSRGRRRERPDREP